MNDNKNSDFRTVRGYQLANQQEGQLTPAQEDYLEMAYRLCLENDYTRVGKLSELLNVKPSSASKMIFKLANLGYLKYDRYEIIQLTDSGRNIGKYLLNRHETVESFLRLIGNSNPLEETELIEHSLSSSTVSDLNNLLEYFRLDTAAQKGFNDFKESRQK
ncbi:iron dependent repressor, metal binding and dimerization domain protein [Desulfosporosinus sp. PR]|uniref:metal-dependent transcriptional regulator n=1 Tax=Candidatus Desulfosporosinus nitrosoreducens TaxID=3401928 RepID=UPI0027FD37C2|nr:iron dependent repressor, metal binding and dimerization domain protein [Desulfosporosinus sp. PR]MDQ7092612.1 iron dependent repressor, metal binding and dimerization domain protein [Desulfosporosinus sp. PR]